jgi:hypothetical protein
MARTIYHGKISVIRFRHDFPMTRPSTWAVLDHALWPLGERLAEDDVSHNDRLTYGESVTTADPSEVGECVVVT